MLLLRGWKQTSKLFWNGTRSTLERLAEFREASARKHDTSSQEYHFDNNVPHRSLVQRRLSIYNWNPGPGRGKEDAFEKQITGKWYVITLQEAIEYVDHDILTNRFHVTLYRGCAVLFNKDKDAFHPNTEVKSLYLHDTSVDWRSTQSHHEEHDRRILLKRASYGMSSRVAGKTHQ